MKIKYKIASTIMSAICAFTAVISGNTMAFAADTSSEVVRGDADGNGVLDTNDVEYIMHYSIGDYRSIEDAADYNQDGVIDIYDACDLYGSLIGAEDSSEKLTKSPELSVGDFSLGQGKNIKTSLYLKNCNVKVGIIRESCELNHGISTSKINDDIVLFVSNNCIVFVNPKGIVIDQAIASLSFFATKGEAAGEVYDISFTVEKMGNSDTEQCSTVVKNGTVTITDGISTTFLKGDVNKSGKVDLYDIIEICKSLMGMKTLTAEEKTLADFNGDGSVNLYDAIEIAKKIMSK